MKTNTKYQIVLKEWNTSKQAAEVTGVVHGGKAVSLNVASRIVNEMNRYNRFTYGGFGQYFDFERVTL